MCGALGWRLVPLAIRSFNGEDSHTMAKINPRQIMRPLSMVKDGKTRNILRVAVLVILALVYLNSLRKEGRLPGFTSDRQQVAEQISRGVSESTGWWTVYFTNPRSGFDASDLSGTAVSDLLALVESAEEYIHLAVYQTNLDLLADALIDAHQRGVEVLWLTDDKHGTGSDGESGRGQFALMNQSGISIRDDGREELMHNKFVVIDGRSVWTGSTNLTTNGIFRNNNNVLLIESEEVAAAFEREFQEMWSGQFGAESPSTVDRQYSEIDGSSVQTLFGPEDNVAATIVDLIRGADRNIIFMAYAFTQDDIGDAMLDRLQQVEIRGIFESRDSDNEHSELAKLACAGADVRTDGNNAAMHHKVIVIDDQIVVTGSFNFSNSADRHNDENVVIINNNELARNYTAEFERLWADSSSPSLAAEACS